MITVTIGKLIGIILSSFVMVGGVWFILALIWHLIKESIFNMKWDKYVKIKNEVLDEFIRNDKRYYKTKKGKKVIDDMRAGC